MDIADTTPAAVETISITSRFAHTNYASLVVELYIMGVWAWENAAAVYI